MYRFSSLHVVCGGRQGRGGRGSRWSRPHLFIIQMAPCKWLDPPPLLRKINTGPLPWICSWRIPEKSDTGLEILCTSVNSHSFNILVSPSILVGQDFRGKKWLQNQSLELLAGIPFSVLDPLCQVTSIAHAAPSITTTPDMDRLIATDVYILLISNSNYQLVLRNKRYMERIRLGWRETVQFPGQKVHTSAKSIV